MRALRHVGGRAALLAALLLAPAAARADIANFDLNGKLYTKWLYQNDDSRGCVSLGNPFWQDNIAGHNGVCTEFELTVKGQVSRYMTAGLRLQSRWGMLWQDWWENGDLVTGRESTSGESLGMNHSAYIKLRGPWMRIAPPIPSVKWLHIGASDFGMFNEWTIGKSRYIDRDNGMGVFVEGAVGNLFSYHTGAIALPKLFVGPGWNTGLSYNEPLAAFWGQDWAYALKLENRTSRQLTVTLIGDWIVDWEADRFDPDKTGTADANRDADHAVDLTSRFSGGNATLEAKVAPNAINFLRVNGLLAGSYNLPNTKYATNGVANNQGFAPVLFKHDAEGNPIASKGLAGKVRVEVDDPFGVGLSFKGEYFNIGSEYNALFGARREADVLLTDGIIGGGFIGGGQLPTLNLANEFVDFDEAWYESCIGWHGATGLLEYVKGAVRASLEYSYIGYNTNMQDRDTDTMYPDFLYTDGFTDTQSYTADSDYGNAYDRGKDPRSVYKKFQDRSTHVVVLTADAKIPALRGLGLKGRFKYVNDNDERKTDNPDDNYRGHLLLANAQLSYQITNELLGSLGYEYQHWKELRRSGSQEKGFYDYFTEKHVARAGVSYVFGGLTFSLLGEYFHKDLDPMSPSAFPQKWNVFRTKATLEAGW